MIKCGRCGTNNLDGSQFCDDCGTQLIDESIKGSNNGAKHRAAAAASSVSNSFDKPETSVDNETPAQKETAQARLVIERGKSAGKEFLIDQYDIQIGRWDADGGIFPEVDLEPDDPEAKVSRRHARIVYRDGQYFIEDLGSTNGTFINRGRRLLPGNSHILNHGDEIIVGKTFLRFYIETSRAEEQT
jgi:pSer/pThr/pTyr-binding forkhead associated (FHA) protein